MAQLLRTPEAVESLFEIWDHIAADSIIAADRLLLKIDETCQLLARNPLIGEARPDLASNLRCFSVENYVILYRPIAEGILVVLVTHGARDIPALYRRMFRAQTPSDD